MKDKNKVELCQALKDKLTKAQQEKVIRLFEKGEEVKAYDYVIDAIFDN